MQWSKLSLINLIIQTQIGVFNVNSQLLCKNVYRFHIPKKWNVINFSCFKGPPQTSRLDVDTYFLQIYFLYSICAKKHSDNTLSTTEQCPFSQGKLLVVDNLKFSHLVVDNLVYRDDVIDHIQLPMKNSCRLWRAPKVLFSGHTFSHGQILCFCVLLIRRNISFSTTLE